jgi:hypothetical protein
MAVALLALFVALGGTGYAVTALPRNSVGSPQLRDRGVKEADVANKAVVTGKLGDQAVTREKLAPGAVTGDRVAPDGLGGAQIDESSLGRVPKAAEAAHAVSAERAALADNVEQAERATRATRADSADTAAVADQATEAARAALAERAKSADTTKTIPGVVRKSQHYVIADGDSDSVIVECDDGMEAVGGGFLTDASSDVPFLYASLPLSGAWGILLRDFFAGDGDPVSGTAYANCVPVDDN